MGKFFIDAGVSTPKGSMTKQDGTALALNGGVRVLYDDTLQKRQLVVLIDRVLQRASETYTQGAGGGGGDLPVITSDLVVYGANPGGLWAAMRARDLGATVTVINDYPENRIGGMLMGILHTDVPTDRGKGVVRMLGDEFYRRVADQYASGAGITQERFMGDSGYGTRPDYVWTALSAMLTERGIVVRNAEPLVSVQKSGTRITGLVTEAAIHRGTTYVDGTYHGDLIAAAGAETFVGRESSAAFSETYAGVRDPASPFALTVSPFITPGNAGSGVVPGIRPTSEVYGNVGDASPWVQSCSFRTWDHPNNQTISTPPPGYDAANYAGAKRNILAKGINTSAGLITSYSLQVNGFDINTNGGSGGPGIVFNWNGPETTEYITASPTRRAEIEEMIKNWLWGYVYWCRTDTDLAPALNTWGASLRIRNVAQWGGDGFPPNYYLRQGRLLRGDFILRGQDILTSAVGGVNRPSLPAVDPMESRMVAQVIYAGDRHPSRILTIDNGSGADGKQIVTEGGMALPTQLGVPVDDRVMYPKVSEVTNLAATFCISATALAQGAMRMEVVSMHLGEAAGVLAWMQKNNGLNLQAQLEDNGRLQTFKQTLDYWGLYKTNGGAIVYPATTNTPPRAPVGVAGGAVTTSGTWTTPSGGGSPSAFLGSAVGSANAVMTLYPTITDPGVYEVRLCWASAFSNARNTATQFEVAHAGGTASTTKDQNVGPGKDDTGDWGLFGARSITGTAEERHAAQVAASRFTFNAQAGLSSDSQFVRVTVPATGGSGLISAIQLIKIS